VDLAVEHDREVEGRGAVQVEVSSLSGGKSTMRSTAPSGGGGSATLPRRGPGSRRSCPGAAVAPELLVAVPRVSWACGESASSTKTPFGLVVTGDDAADRVHRWSPISLAARDVAGQVFAAESIGGVSSFSVFAFENAHRSRSRADEVGKGGVAD